MSDLSVDESPTAADDASTAMVHLPKNRKRACQHCTQSKLKCIWPIKSDADSCERCLKNNIPCLSREATRRKRRAPSKRVEQLEVKVDSLMSLLRAGQLNGDVPRTLSPSPYVRIAPHTASSQLLPLQEPTQPHSSTPISTGTMQEEYITIVPGFQVTFDEAESALDLYRTSYVPWSPFVPIPASITAHELYESAPLLCSTILAVVMPQTAAIQKDLQQWFRQQIAQHVVVEQERRLELLQAILVFVAWGNFQFYIESQATDLLQLAAVLVVDLGLDKSPDSVGPSRLSFVPTAIRKVKGFVHQRHGQDDMRAMLGCFYLHAVVTTLFRRTRNVLFNTPYITYCCDKLLEMQEYDWDQCLVACVRIQQTLIHVSDALSPTDLHESANRSWDMPLQMLITTARKELESLVKNQPPKVAANVLLWINYHGATMRLYEPAIHMRTPRLQTNPVASIRRAEALWGCLEAAKDFFATYATIPLDMLGSMPLTATAYMSFATVTSSMILLLEDPDWDVNLARKTFDFAAACHNLGSRFREGDQIIQSLGRRRRFEENGKSTLEANYNKIMWIRQWYSSKISTLLAAEPTPRSSSQHPPPVIQQTDASVTQSIHADQSPLQDSCLLPLDLDAEFWHAMLDSHALTEWTD